MFFCTTALLALEIAQLAGLIDLILNANDKSTDAKFKILYALIARETKITGVLFECQVSQKYSNMLVAPNSKSADDPW